MLKSAQGALVRGCHIQGIPLDYIRVRAERLRTSKSCMSSLSVTPRTSPADQGSSEEKMLFRKSAMEEHSASSSTDMSSELCGQ